MYRLLTAIIIGVVVSGSLLLMPQSAYAACNDFSCDSCTGKQPDGTVDCRDCSSGDCTDCSTKVNQTCQRKRLLDPCTYGEAGCCAIVYCAGLGSSDAPRTTGNKVLNVNFFGISMKLEEDKQVASFIYILFSFFFGFVALAITLIGIYGAFLRSRAESADDEAKAAKLLTNAVVGLILIVLSVVIVQLVASSLGIGSLDQLVDFGGVFG